MGETGRTSGLCSKEAASPSIAPPPPPPAAGRSKFGLHIHQGSPDPNTAHNYVAQLAETGRLASAVIINDVQLANRLRRAGCPYVIIRPVFGDGDTHPDLSGTDRDIVLGQIWYRGNATQSLHVSVDSGVYIQPYGCNERNRSDDGYFYLGMMQEADKQGRKLAIFGDGVGHPADFQEETINGQGTGYFFSGAWDMRVRSGAAQHAKEHGHIYIYHGYGRMTPEGKETSDPGSAYWFSPSGEIIRKDDGAWFWYGGRHLSYYFVIKPNRLPLVPPECRMDVILGECGPSDAIWRGVKVLTDDARGYDLRLANDPYTKGIAYWTVGGAGAFKFGYSTIDDGLPGIVAWRLAQPA